ncbi:MULTISPECIES: hypothetical protein [Enterobacteriaceae]|uniref:hypothetical protein n=1 Tax=Enterobacteriaceae TaxID=543 RepID=UPI000C7A0C0D|nr:MULTISPECIES: hypothetical protein [Enterobacteriaceae]HBS4243098.1 hypothetical protein [Klebsiella quasipneumoniae subsp. quasipneumoniae]MBS2826119.1 hypothetical protein [Klebsiella pneumoniae]PLJ66816.1 hypothetical protein B6J69_26625 [Klebsiella pneumoniae]UFH12625.1 hypothetical protein LOX64_25455 [Klebsiella pneumoniae]UKW22708.1 hypothetical protein MBA36_23825 [Enterobacter cloacae]
MKYAHKILLFIILFSSGVMAEDTEKTQVAIASEQINNLRTDPVWVHASLAERKDLYDKWISVKYMPYIMSFQDVNLRTALFLLPERILKPDIVSLEEICKDSKLPTC